MKKLLISVMSAICCFVAVFAGCGEQNSDNIGEENKQQYENLEEQKEELVNNLDKIKEKNDELFNQFEDKGKDFYLNNCSFDLLEGAYETGKLSQEDIKYISYFYNRGNVYAVPDGVDARNTDKWQKMHFVPEISRFKIEGEVEKDIKLSYFYHNIKYFQDSNGNLREEANILEIRFLGEYNGNYVVIVDSPLWGYGASVRIVNYGGIVWWQSAPKILVFSYTNRW